MPREDKAAVAVSLAVVASLDDYRARTGRPRLEVTGDQARAALASEGSFRKAAAALGTSEATVRRRARQ